MCACVWAGGRLSVCMRGGGIHVYVQVCVGLVMGVCMYVVPDLHVWMYVGLAVCVFMCVDHVMQVCK